jgi:hypothetical protein
MRYTYEIVKEYIETQCEELISTKYKNCTELLTIKCHVCSEEYEKGFRNYKNGSRHVSCSNSKVKKRSYASVKEYIENEGDKLISTEYINGKKKLMIECNLCETEYEQNFDRYRVGNKHQHCPMTISNSTLLEPGVVINTKSIDPKVNPLMAYNLAVKNGERQPSRGTSLIDIVKSCISCCADFKPKRRNQKVCDANCRKLLEKQKAANGHFKRLGHIGGVASAAVQVRRSQNEIAFADMCIEKLPMENILCNEPIFDGWDADIVLNDMKIAILWNGIWHYKQVRSGHNLEEVQRRDKLKNKIIKRMGYTPYIIKDMGGFSQQLVKKEFKKLCAYIAEYV